MLFSHWLHRIGVAFALLSFLLPLAYAQESAVAQGVSRTECFPFERLPAELRPKAEALLLKLLDSEGLFTVIGGMKPMSSGFGTYKINVKMPDTRTLEEARQILSVFRCGNAYVAEVLPFYRTQNDTRYFEAVFFHRPTVRQMVRTYPDFFSPYGITPETDPFAMALIVEHDPTTARNRGLGYLFGYPKHAVDFFVASADAQGETKETVPRDFIQIPVFESPTGRFVYAVPKGHKENDADRTLREKAGRILAAYKERRATYIREGKPGVLALIRDWLDNGAGRYAPEFARY